MSVRSFIKFLKRFHKLLISFQSGWVKPHNSCYPRNRVIGEFGIHKSQLNERLVDFRALANSSFVASN